MPSSISLEKNRVWVGVSRCSSISVEQANTYRGLLSKAEREHNKKYRFERDRHRDLVARALVRTTLADVLNVSARQLQFELGDKGKPQLTKHFQLSPNGVINFNLSHAGDWVILVIAHQPVGVDIEYTPRKNDVLSIAEHYFHGEEIKELLSFPKDQQRERFFDYWTLKEAYMKARGEGIALGLKNFAFRLTAGQSIGLFTEACIDENPSQWWFDCRTPEPDYRLALAVKARSCPDLFFEEVQPMVASRTLNW